MGKELTTYRKKRDFRKTPEPKDRIPKKKSPKRIFVIQKHHARTLHYDFRIEIDGVLKSWAVPKGPSKKTSDKRLAVQTEDHPIAYAKFAGRIPEGEYGAGKVEIWDSGTYENLKTYKNGNELSMKSCHRKGRIEIYLSGKKLKGAYALIQFKGKNWLLIKMKKRIEK